MIQHKIQAMSRPNYSQTPENTSSSSIPTAAAAAADQQLCGDGKKRTG